MREPLVPHDAAQTIAAAGIAPVSAKLPAEERTTPIAARAYPHPALDGKIIVRLESEAVAEGVDAEMAAFGFEAPKVSTMLGKVRYRTLGFPAWGLVNVPKTAKVALGVMEDVRKAKRMVAAKPGHAKDAFEKIAKALQKASPQLLPSFWEEVGRVVADQASATMAAQCFERARQAERAFKLKIDADDCDAVFVEFALLGALSAKSLSQYAKDLGKAEGGAQAYKRFRSIAVKRALGGMPPWSGMGKDIRSLAEDAELDVDKEDEALVAELLDAPAIGKAPMEFWSTYHDALVRLARTNAAIRTRLRALWPDPSGGTRDQRGAKREAWVALLDEVGAFADLPDDGLGAWVSKLLSYVGGTPRVIALLRELAPRLKTQPIEVNTPRGRWRSGLDLDIAELALELGIALAEPSGTFSPESMNCDPVRVAAHPEYGPKLVESVADMIGEPEHEHRMRGKRGFDAARKAWVSEHLDKLAAHPLSCTVETIDTLEGKTTAELFVPFPDQWERLRAMDLSAALAAQLRAGIADEFGWPAYEAAFAKFGAEVTLSGCFPILVLYNKSKAIALDATGVIAEHDLVYKAKEHEVKNVTYIDGQFLVELSPTKGWGRIAYWSGEPKQRHEKLSLDDIGVATTLADGSVTCSGGKSFRAGDAETSGINNYYVDGDRFWKYEWRAKDSLRELDPIKGAQLGTGMPEWFARPWPKELAGSKLELRHSSLHRAPVGLSSSPLGVANGRIGMRVRDLPDDDDNNYECERIDGLVHICSSTSEQLVVFPGDATPRAADSESASNARFPGGSGQGVSLAGDGGHTVTINEKDWAARGWGAVHVPPLLWWHFFVPRDVAGSTALRKITVEQARAILAAARAELAAASGGAASGGAASGGAASGGAASGGNDESGRELPATQAKIREVLGVTDAKLARGIAGVVELAAEQAARIDTLAAERSKANADPGGEGLTGAGQKLRKLLVALHTGRTGKVADFDIDPGEWLQRGRVKAVEALLPFATADERRVARDMLRAIAMTPFADDTKGLRLLSISEPDDWSDPEEWNTLVISKQDGSTFAVHGSDNWALEYSSDGTFRTPKPWTSDEATELKTPIGGAWANAFVALPDEPVAWDAAFATALAEKSGLSVPEAVLLYCGIPTRGYRKDFLGKDKRAIVGLKMTEADAARTSFQDIDADKRKDLFDKAVPADASLLRTPLAPDGYVDRLAKAWKQKFGKRAKIAQDLIAAAKKDLSLGNDLAKYLAAFAGEVDVEFLKPDLRPLHELGGWGDDHGLTWNTGKELATLIAWLFLQRPVGDPIRNGIPAIVGALVKCTDNAKALWKLDDFYFDDEDPKTLKLRDQLFDLVGGKSITLPKAAELECKRAFDDGTIVIGEYNEVIAGFRPAKLEGAARKKVETLARAMANSEEHTEDTVLQEVRVAALLRTEGFAAFGERVEDTSVAAGKYEADPRESAPKLVAKVAKATGLSTDAAALYLQILALAEPTERNVQTWNGWTAKQYKVVAAELAKKKLVVEGKRERAGRGIFLKGGYSKGDKRELPMEDWKQPYYTELERHVPAEPCHLLFARVWKRIEDGDKPA